GISCSDGNCCNGLEWCTGGVCVPGPAPTCNDNNACTADVCNPATGACSFTKLADGTSCPGSDPCDGRRCLAGTCLNGPSVLCSDDGDNNPCTVSRCAPGTGVCTRTNAPEGTPCPDATVCNGMETCHAGQCTGAGTPLSCPSDSNPCTVD